MSNATLSAVVGYVRRLAARDTHGASDPQLLERFAGARDETAFTELVRRHGPMVLAVCRRVLGQEQDAEDVFQAAFLVLARKASSIQQHASIGGWLYQVAFRLALRANAVNRRRALKLASLAEGFQLQDQRLARESLRIALDDELAHLPEQYRTPLVLCYLEGRTQTEAARLLATTIDAVNSRLKRARDLLRQRLVRSGAVVSAAALSQALTAGTARAVLPAALLRATVDASLHFATCRAAASGASAVAVALAKGTLHTMMTAKIKNLSALAILFVLLIAGAIFVSPPALGEDPTLPSARSAATQPQNNEKPTPQPDAKGKLQKSVIILWMNGGPSQIDTFDPKPTDPNGILFAAIDTNVKGVQISQILPRLAKQANHLAIIRSLTHREGDHNRGTYLMRTGFEIDGGDHPALGCVLAKELGRPDVPRYISIAPPVYFKGPGFGPGPLFPPYAPLIVGERRGGGKEGPDDLLKLPGVEVFEALAKGQGDKHRKAVTKAFDLAEEKAAVRDAYGRTIFGQGCLLALRLIEAGVSVVEITQPGWDTHADALNLMPRLGTQLDDAWSSLLNDLERSKRLEHTLIVWMGEFGRTPRINNSNGRDHWPMSFSVVLAGCGIKGGQVIGKTSGDGVRIDERPVTPAELFATIYQAVGIDYTKENRTIAGTKAVKEALR